MILLLLLVGSSYANIRLDKFEIKKSPLYIKSNVNGMWVDTPEMIDGSLYVEAKKNFALSHNQNELSNVLVEPSVLSDNPLYIGGKKSIEVSANIHSNLPGMWVQPPEINHVPFYVNSLKEIELAVINLKDNLLSMSGAIPYLSDPRRDIAEIINVIYGIAKEVGQSCSPIHYEKSYQKLINIYAPNGIRRPQVVVNDVQSGLSKFNSWIHPVQMLIRILCRDQPNPRDCDYVIHRVVVNQPERYQTAAKVFFAGYKAAHTFNLSIKEFSAISNCHEAHKFIIESPWKIKPVIYELAQVIRITTPLRSNC